MLVTAKEKLAKKALSYQNAWLFSCMWLGFHPAKEYLRIPDYISWKKEILLGQIDLLAEDFKSMLNQIAIVKSKQELESAIQWFSDKFDIVLQLNNGKPFTICTAYEFEKRIGKLLIRNEIEVPGYTEILFQSWHGVAFRHPEYMLSRDLELFYFLFINTENYLDNVDWSKEDNISASASENSQSLARSVIQTCFNLLESFISGIAKQHLLMNPKLDDNIKTKLLDNNLPLRKRILEIPKIVKGKPLSIDYNNSPLKEIFGQIKFRRDSFVHCEPGKQDTKWGYIKEDMFNDVSKDIVIISVNSTLDLIKIIWQHVYEIDGPKWLPDIQNFEKLKERNLNLNLT